MVVFSLLNFVNLASTYRPDMRVLKLTWGAAVRYVKELQPIDPT